MVLEEPVEREAEAPLGKPARTAVAARTAICKQFLRRLALVEVLRTGDRRRQEDCGGHAKQGAMSPRPNRSDDVKIVPYPRQAADQAASNASNSAGA